MDKKEVTMITTAHYFSIDLATGKFQANVSYNKRKGYVDLTDHMFALCSYIRRSNKMVHTPILSFGHRSMYAKRLGGLRLAREEHNVCALQDEGV
ncbi:hypothetical protein KIN20_036569 [Parelaphostrongylus tenuis]|uniref:Uncharacterized protein n=1 Tax=Parelaphostrongylus tenuis TaxID=148309 RepID=A0AAD5R9A5_PARTN|nr:hypothetical protein KIN20_032695 [Parelaphostrongylus tenuis]KAJ1373990.1 hypothetical protein KIN20_036569 [Parelaphostrongylus tenuis]